MPVQNYVGAYRITILRSILRFMTIAGSCNDWDWHDEFRQQAAIGPLSSLSLSILFPNSCLVPCFFLRQYFQGMANENRVVQHHTNLISHRLDKYTCQTWLLCLLTNLLPHTRFPRYPLENICYLMGSIASVSDYKQFVNLPFKKKNYCKNCPCANSASIFY